MAPPQAWRRFCTRRIAEDLGAGFSSSGAATPLRATPHRPTPRGPPPSRAVPRHRPIAPRWPSGPLLPPPGAPLVRLSRADPGDWQHRRPYDTYRLMINRSLIFSKVAPDVPWPDGTKRWHLAIDIAPLISPSNRGARWHPL